jgi:predicted phage terminase large subunit-like protein
MEQLAAIRKERNRRSIEADRQAVAEGGFKAFIPRAFKVVEPGTTYRGNWHVGAIAEVLEEVSAARLREVALHMPPGTMKSLIVSVLWPVWDWLDRPNDRFFSISYLPELALDHTRRSRDLILSDWFQERWGDRFQIPVGSAMGEYENDRFGWRSSASIGGGITGWHCDKMVIDDPINPKELTPAGLKAADHWWRTTRPTRYRDLATACTVLVMQRLHEADPGATAREQGFQVITIPMEYEPRVAWARDPRKEPGELLWDKDEDGSPGRFPAAEVAKLKKSLGALNAAAQLQQSPTPAGGLVFKSLWFRTWVKLGTPPPVALLEGELADVPAWMTLPPRFDRIIQSWDCTFKDIKTADWVVGQVWGVKGPDFFLLDQFRGQENVLGTAQAILDMTRKWPRATAVLVEAKANGDAVMTILKKKVRGMIAIEPEGGKEARAQAVATFFESGNVYHPDACAAGFEWVTHHRKELTTFPMDTHDDTVDACSQALTWLHTNRGSLGGLAAGLEKMGGIENLLG